MEFEIIQILIFFKYSDGAINNSEYIDGKKYYYSNKEITLNINPVTSIIIDGKEMQQTNLVTSHVFTDESIIGTPPKIHNITIVNWKYTYSFSIVIKSTPLKINDSYFSTPLSSGTNITQYRGYLFSNERKPVMAKTILNPIYDTYTTMNIAKFNSSLAINYSKSYYVDLESSFKVNKYASKKYLNINGESITVNTKTLYLLHIEDFFGAIQEFYIQMGGATSEIPDTANTNAGIITTGKVIRGRTVDGIKYDYFTNQTAVFYNGDDHITKITINGEEIPSDLLLNPIPLEQIPDNYGKYIIKTYLNGSETPNQTFNVLVRDHFNTSIDDFTNNKGNPIDAHMLYVYKDYKYTLEKTIINLDSSTEKANTIKMNLQDSALDTYGYSYYQKISQDNKPNTNPKIYINNEDSEIKGTGLFKLVLTDQIGNQDIYYVQIGGDKTSFPKQVQKKSIINPSFYTVNIPRKVEGKIDWNSGKRFICKI